LTLHVKRMAVGGVGSNTTCVFVPIPGSLLHQNPCEISSTPVTFSRWNTSATRSVVIK
jgi:hypothetical protein